MTYKELLRRIARKTRLTPDEVSAVLYALPEMLVDSKVGEQTKTPFGTFHTRLQKRRQVKIPTTGELAEVPSKVVVRLRSGYRLRREP